MWYRCSNCGYEFSFVNSIGRGCERCPNCLSSKVIKFYKKINLSGIEKVDKL